MQADKVRSESTLPYVLLLIGAARATTTCHQGMRALQRPISDFASAQFDLSLRCLLTESLDTTECMNGNKGSG